MYDRNKIINNCLNYLNQYTCVEIAQIMAGLISKDSENKLSDLLLEISEQARLENARSPEKKLNFTSYALKILAETAREKELKNEELGLTGLENLGEIEQTLRQLKQTTFLHTIDALSYPILQNGDSDLLDFLKELSNVLSAHHASDPEKSYLWGYVAIQLEKISKFPPEYWMPKDGLPK